MHEVSREKSGLMRLAGGGASLAKKPALPALWKVPSQASPALKEVTVSRKLKGNKPQNDRENEQRACNSLHARHSIPRNP
jgi:hypothetical protein